MQSLEEFLIAICLKRVQIIAKQKKQLMGLNQTPLTVELYYETQIQLIHKVAG